MIVRDLAPDVRDARYVNAALFLPDLLSFLFALFGIVYAIWGGPLLVFIGLTILAFMFSLFIRRRSIAAIFILALFLSLFWIGGVWGILQLAISEKNLPVAALFIGLGFGPLLVPVLLCCRAVPAVIRLRRRFKKMPGYEAIARWRMPRGLRALQLVLPAVILLFFAATGLIAMLVGALVARGLGAAIALHPFARGANKQYRRILQILALGAHEMRDLDQRPSILLLHSFGDDDLAINRIYRIWSRPLQLKLSLEELIVERVWRLGPVFAVGKPKEVLSPLGAPREYLDGSLWQPEINARLKQSAAVVSVLAETKGILWEYRCVLSNQKSLLVVAPPATFAVMLSRWKSFSAVFSPAAAISLPLSKKSLPLLAWFPSSGQPAVWLCDKQNETAYTLAFDDFFQTVPRLP